MGNPKVIYRPVVSVDEGYFKISYHNTKGKNVSFHTESVKNAPQAKAIAELPKQIAKLATGKKPNINPDELQEAFYKNIYVGSLAAGYGWGGHMADVVAIANMADKLINKFSKPDSEGGKMITPNEQYKMMEYWHQWFKAECE